jgi:hypothetical protein
MHNHNFLQGSRGENIIKDAICQKRVFYVFGVKFDIILP